MHPYSKEFVDDLKNMLNDIEEDIPEVSILEKNNLSIEADVDPRTKHCEGEPCSRTRTSTAESNSSEAVQQLDIGTKTVTFPSEMQVARAKKHEEYDLTADLLYYEND